MSRDTATPEDILTRDAAIAFWAGRPPGAFEAADGLEAERAALLREPGRPVPRRALSELNAERAALLPGIDAFEAARIEAATWFDVEELAAATGLPEAALETVLYAPGYVLPDGTALQPRPMRYVLRRADWEAAGIPAPGYAVDAATAAGEAVVLQPADFEARPDPLPLKAAFEGRMIPVVEDAAGIERRFLPGALEIWTDGPVTPERADAILDALGLEPRPVAGMARGDLLAVGLVPARLPRETGGDLLAATLEAAEHAATAEGVAFVELAEMPRDEDWEGDWEEAKAPLPRPNADADAALHWAAEAVGLDAAHAVHRGDPRVVVLMIDGGTVANHPDIAHAMDGADRDFSGGARAHPDHGTAVASVAVGRGHARGVAPGCRLRSWRISGGASGQGYALRAAAIRAAVASLASTERGVMTLSWNTGGRRIRSIEEAIGAAAAADVPVVMSAGNGDPDTVAPDTAHWPSRLAMEAAGRDAMLAVAATGPNGARAPYSYHGAASVSLAAPGGVARRAGAGIPVALTPPRGRGFEIGTSFAAPCAAGAAALIRSLDPDLDAAGVLHLLRETCRAGDPDLGAGTLDAGEALRRAAPAPCACPLPPDEADGDDGAPEAGGPTDPTRAPVRDPVSVNEADAPALAALPGIGAARAAAIVARRAQGGGFRSLWQLVFPGGLDAPGLLATAGLLRL